MRAWIGGIPRQLLALAFELSHFTVICGTDTQRPPPLELKTRIQEAMALIREKTR
jgi:hypothetical protein